jgi:hypothetical protein
VRNKIGGEKARVVAVENGHATHDGEESSWTKWRLGDILEAGDKFQGDRFHV